MATFAPFLDVGEQCLWRENSVKSIRVLEFPHPRVFYNGGDELRSLSPLRLVGSAVGSLGFVHCFFARTDNGRGIVIDPRVVSANSCGFNKFRSVAHCVRCHQPNEAGEVVFTSRFFLQDLEEERRHYLPDSREGGVRRLDVY